MATKYLNVRGFIKWAQIYQPEEYMGDVRFITSFYPADATQKAKIVDSGLQMAFKEDEDGEFIRIRRSLKKAFPGQDEVTYFTPPKITGEVEVKYVDKATDEVIKQYQKSEKREIVMDGKEVLLGNGTEVVANIAVYDTRQGKGHRWESVKVLNLVEYNPNKEDAVDEKEEVSKEVEKKAAAEKPAKQPKSQSDETLAKQVKPEKVAKNTAPETSLKDDMNDEIPW